MWSQIATGWLATPQLEVPMLEPQNLKLATLLDGFNKSVIGIMLATMYKIVHLSDTACKRIELAEVRKWTVYKMLSHA